MKVIGERNNLLKGIQTVQGVVGDKTILPILANVIIETTNGGISFTVTDLKISIKIFLQLEVLEKGTITLPAKKFNDIIRELPEKKIELTTEEHKVKISCDKINYQILGSPKEEFPKLPTIKEESVLTINSSIFKNMIKKTIFSSSSDDTRYVLSGCFLKINKNIISLSTTDGHRLSYYEHKGSYNTGLNVIIPNKTLNELLKIIEEEKELHVLLSKNKIKFKIDNIEIISSLVEGEFPNTDGVLKKEYKENVAVETEKFIKSTKRVSIVATEKSNAIKLLFSNNLLTVFSQTPDIGEAKEDIEIKYPGPETLFLINYKYLLDAIKSIEEESTEINFNEATTSILITPKSSKNLMHIIMPIRQS